MLMASWQLWNARNPPAGMKLVVSYQFFFAQWCQTFLCSFKIRSRFPRLALPSHPCGIHSLFYTTKRILCMTPRFIAPLNAPKLSRHMGNDFKEQLVTFLTSHHPVNSTKQGFLRHRSLLANQFDSSSVSIRPNFSSSTTMTPCWRPGQTTSFVHVSRATCGIPGSAFQRTMPNLLDSRTC